MSQSLFADGIAEITAAGGIVRIEFFALSIDRKAPLPTGEPSRMQVDRTVTVAMPIAGFVAAFKSIDDFKQKLIDTGALKVNRDQEQPSATVKAGN